MSSIYYEIALRFLSGSSGLDGLLKQIFHQCGFDEASLIVLSEKKYSYIKVYLESKREAEQLVRRLKKSSLKKVDVLFRRLGEKDWRDKWKHEIRPFKLTQGFDVVPVWNQQGYRPGKREAIYLNTTLAFGTGLHETTRFTGELIEKSRGKFKSFLDIGTGTGILSVIGAKCGAAELWAVDIDENSINTSVENLARNGLAFDSCWAMDFRKFRSKKNFDFVAANVITDELIVMRKKIVSVVKSGKYLALSGISLANLGRLKTAFADQPLRCLKIVKGKKWAAILYRKIE